MPRKCGIAVKSASETKCVDDIHLYVEDLQCGIYVRRDIVRSDCVSQKAMPVMSRRALADDLDGETTC